MNQSIQNKTEIFEQKVFTYLLIDPVVFDTCVVKHNGYALLLRHWIEESYQKGTTADQVAKNISNSPLRLEKIKNGQPLTWAA